MTTAIAAITMSASAALATGGQDHQRQHDAAVRMKRPRLARKRQQIASE